MPGFGDRRAVTPGRRTAVVLDRFTPTVVEPFYFMQRTAGEMARERAAEHLNVVYTEGIGLHLRPYQLSPHVIFERTNGQSGFLGVADASVAPGFLARYTSRTYSYTGVSYSGVASQGRPMFQKQVSAAGSWGATLSGDLSAFAQPEPGDDPVTLDRVFVSNALHDPTEIVHFEIGIPGALSDYIGPLATLYFTGPAGGGVAPRRGLGQYALKIRGDGSARLYERCVLVPGGGGLAEYSWELRARMSVASQLAAASVLYITVATDAVALPGGGWKCKRVAIKGRQSFDAREGAGLGETLVTAAASLAALAVSSEARPHVYVAPQAGSLAIAPAALRLDARRDVRILFSVQSSRYPLDGAVFDAPFSLPFWPSVGPGREIYLEWSGRLPSTCSATVRLYDASDPAAPVEVYGTLSVSDHLGQIWRFTLAGTRPGRTYRCKIELYGDGSSTPVVQDVRVYRRAVTEQVVVEETEIIDSRDPDVPMLPALVPVAVDCSGGSVAPDEDAATVEIADLTGSQETLTLRTGRPVDIEVQDPATGDAMSVLFHGLVARTAVRRTPRPDGDYAAAGSAVWTLEASGEWARLRRQLCSARLVLDDKAAGLPIKATDAIRILLTDAAGYPADMVDVPDLPVRLFTDAGGDNLLVLEPGTPVVEPIREIAEDYLGRYLCFDSNAGDRGMWRLLARKVPPYNHLLKVYREAPGPTGGGSLRLPHDLAAYEVEDVGGGQFLVPTYALRGTEQYVYQPPECNLVQVFGGAPAGWGSSVQAHLTQVAANMASANLLGLPSSDPGYPDPSSPDFLGEAVPVQVYDPALTTQAAVDFVCRRVFEAAAFGLEAVRFRAPLRFVVDASDALQRLPRPPRFSDPILYQQPDGSFRTYLLSRVSPRYDADGLMFADFEAVTSTNIDVVGIPLPAFDFRSLSRARIRAAKQAVGQPPRSRQRVGRQREFIADLGNYVAWPAVAAPAIQQLDSSEPDFGRFFFMPDYDPVP